jgi:pimeloyl-ACP methyl ester carboxylesterase
VSYWLGNRARASHRADYDFACCGYAWHYIQATATPSAPDQPTITVLGGDAARAEPPPIAPSAFDPRFRLACELYNDALTRWLRTAVRKGKLAPKPILLVRQQDGAERPLPVAWHGFPWPTDEVGPLEIAADRPMDGLVNRYRTYGLGVPLLGQHRSVLGVDAVQFLPEASFPATAMLRFEGSPGEVSRGQGGRLEIVNPLCRAAPNSEAPRESGLQLVSVAGSPAVALDGKTIPLESDLTTPLVRFLSSTGLKEFDLQGFINSDRLKPVNGIYLMEPYQPGKIPVLLVHGLLSSPITWVPLFNDLRSDPDVRSRYQFWFYLYTTGTPYLESAADLRAALPRLRAALDPRGEDAALDRMVCVCHSMGGLVSKLQVVDSGDDFWHLVSDQPLEELRANTQTRAQLQRAFYFERNPSIQRLVFICTPHHGSRLSPTLAGRFAAYMVRLPERLREASADLLAENPQLRLKRLPTSVDLLAPGNPALTILAARPAPPGVHFHSVIGDAPRSSVLRHLTQLYAPMRGSSDGVVPYSSAHLEGVDSEVIVPADHLTVHQHPLTIQEVRRILRIHLEEGASRPGGPISEAPHVGTMKK